jgi:hypothetical protein
MKMKKIALAALATAALACAPPPAPDVTGLAPFVGGWGSHVGGVTIDANGHGRHDFQDPSHCPTCTARSQFPMSSVDFTLTSVSGSTATGSVTGSSDPAEFSVGEPVDATLKPGLQGKGVVLQLNIGSDVNWTFCNNTSMGQCGA